MGLFNGNVLSLLLGVPAAILIIIYGAVALVKRRRDANWAHAAELEKSPQNEDEKAALEEYDSELDDQTLKSVDSATDEEFYKKTLIERRLQNLPDLSTDTLGKMVFSDAEYPTSEDQDRLLAVLKQKNPHCHELVHAKSGWRLMFKQIGWNAKPTSLKNLDLAQEKPTDWDHEAELPYPLKAYVSYLTGPECVAVEQAYTSMSTSELSTLIPVLSRILGSGHPHVRSCMEEAKHRIGKLEEELALAAKKSKKTKKKPVKKPTKTNKKYKHVMAGLGRKPYVLK